MSIQAGKWAVKHASDATIYLLVQKILPNGKFSGLGFKYMNGMTPPKKPLEMVVSNNSDWVKISDKDIPAVFKSKV